MIFQLKFLSNMLISTPKKLTDIFNESIKMSKFPDIQKKTEVTPVNKKDGMNDK